MNILPLVMALVLMLSILTVQQVEKYKNQTIVQNEYRASLKTHENTVFNKREKNLFGDYKKNLRQMTFRYIVDKAVRDKAPSVAAQYRLLNIELIKIVYGNAPFYQALIKKRPHFVEELITAIEQAADAAPKKTIWRIQDMSRLDLGDEELQEAFFHILKGTESREVLKSKTFENQPSSILAKGYPSLFTFINYNKSSNSKDSLGFPQIEIQKSPREILKAVFIDDEVVEAIIKKRKELSLDKKELSYQRKNETEEAFRKEFEDKRRPLIENTTLSFKISETDKDDYD